MKELRVNIPGREYSIFIGGGILKETGAMLRRVHGGRKAAVVTDENVRPLYGGAVENSLGESGFESTVIAVPAGEGSKSLEVLQRVYGGLVSAQITRSDLIVALGGGVVGDLAGYAAATFLRGVKFAQIPTTLLSQADSSVGGKVAINLPQGKNLVGAFNQPLMVVTDTDTLNTLSARVFSDGMGEVIKHGAIADAALFETLETGDFDREEIIFRNCDIKRRVVEADEFDTGGRMVLNFGHTFGHAIEAENLARHGESSAGYTHGECVSMGMVMAAELGERMGVTAVGTAARLEKVLTRYHLPARLGREFNREAILLDKKRDGGRLNLILLREIGHAVIHTVAVSQLKGLM